MKRPARHHLHDLGCACARCAARRPSDPNRMTAKEIIAITLIIGGLLIGLPRLIIWMMP